MEYKGIRFDAVVATPCCGKSYLCDKYPDKFVDVDELRLKCKYFVPQNITREELEKTKGQRTFERRTKGEEFLKLVNSEIKKQYDMGKVLILAPHPEAVNFLIDNNIKFCFVYPNKNMKEEIKNRMIRRKNPEQTIKENDDMFYEFYNSNSNESRSVVNYEFGQDEYLEDILRKFGIEF